MGNLIEGSCKSNIKNTCTYSKNTTSCTNKKIKKRYWGIFGRQCVEIVDRCKCPYYQGKPKGKIKMQ